MKHRRIAQHSIRWKLLLTMIGLIVILLTLSTVMHIIAQKEILEIELDKRIILMKEKLFDRGETLVINLTNQVINRMATANLSLLPEILQKAIKNDPDLHFAILMDSERTAFIHTLHPELEQETLNSIEDSFAAIQPKLAINEYDKDTHSFIEFVAPIQISLEPWGVLRLGFSLDRLNQEILASRAEISLQIQEMIARSLITAGIFILFGTGIVVLVSNKLSRPLVKLTSMANALAKGNFSASKEVQPSTTSEIDMLASALIQMAEDLKSSYKHLEENNRTLEHKVKQRTEQLVDARDEAVSANNSKSEFLSIVSHEIRTPMNAILGMSRLLLKTDLTIKQHDFLQKIQASGKTLLNIINDILDFSKIEAGKMEFEHVEFNLEKVLNNLSSLVSFDVNEKGLSIYFNVDSDVPLHLIGDPMRLSQVLLNLINNAIKFTASGEIIVSIEQVTNLADKNQRCDTVKLHFAIQDTGIGLSEAQVTQLFQPFSQADISTTRKYGGTGMGLAICKRLVEIMGGTISVSSQLHKGSVFSFTANFEFSNPSKAQSLLIPESLHNLQVLIIDDDTTAREALYACLESMHFAVTSTNSLHSGIEQLEQSTATGGYQLVLLGSQKNQTDEIAITNIIRQSNLNATALKIIKLIPLNMEKSSEYAHLNVDKILTKPVNTTLLLSAIQELFHENPQERVRTITIDRKHELALRRIRGAHLLLVEDQLINQLVAKEFLTQAGFIITIAGNGKKALQLLQNGQFDAVLMDLQMPEMDGYETCLRIRKNKQYSLLPIIAMTAHVMAGEREKCLHIGMNDYIAKPIDEEKLHASLVKWIEPTTESTEINSGKESHDPDNELSLQNFPGLDIQQGLINVAGNKTLLNSLLQDFSTSFADSAAHIRKQLESHEIVATRQLIHALKGVADILGLVDIQVYLTTLTTAVNERQEQIPEAINALETALNQVLESIDSLSQSNEKVQPKLKYKAQFNCDDLPLLVQKLITLARANSYETELYLRDLQSNYGHCKISREIEQLSYAIKAYDFETAQAILISIAAKLKIDIENIPEQLLLNDDRQKILIVDDEPINIRYLIGILKQNYNITVTSRGKNTFAIASSDDPPDLILLDVEMPDIDGYQVCRNLKQNDHTRNIPVIFITGRNNIHDEQTGLESGSVDYISKPYSAAVVNARIETHLRLKKQNDLLEQLVCQDALTLIPNRRRFDELLKIEWRRAQRSQFKLTLIFVDVDFFKEYNDHYGHSCGDNCLKQVAQKLNNTLKRPTDVVARYGGEEFVAILPDTDIHAGLIKAEQMRENIYSLNLPHEKSSISDRVTISLGVACLTPKLDSSSDSLLKIADDALYAAKREGRNRVSPTTTQT